MSEDLSPEGEYSFSKPYAGSSEEMHTFSKPYTGSFRERYTFSRPYRYVETDEDFSIVNTMEDDNDGAILFRGKAVAIFFHYDNDHGGVQLVCDQIRTAKELNKFAKYLATFLKKRGWQVMSIINHCNDITELLIDQLELRRSNSFLDAGFVPSFAKDDNLKEKESLVIVQSYVDLIENRPLSADDIKNLSNSDIWKAYDTSKVQISSTNKPANIAPLFLGRGRKLLFNITNRPYTAMFNFRDPNAKTNVTHALSKERAINQVYDANGEIVFLIRVSRYSVGMSRGLYFESNVGKYCGTFYYYEPDSDVLLNIGHKGEFEMFRNKVEAAISLSKRALKVSSPEFSDVIKYSLYTLDGVIERMAKSLPKKILDEPKGDREIADALWAYWSGRNTTKWLAYNDDTYVKEWYALEDPLDQMICTSARLLRLKVLILSNMTGANRLVTEVLDTRSREESVHSLVFEIK